MKRLSVAALYLVLVSPGVLPLGATGATLPAAKIEDLAWMAGSWAGEEGKVQMDEHWTAAKGGAMLGVHRDVADGRMVSFEFLRIEATPGGLAYLSMPQGRPVTAFPLAKLEGKRVVFENPTHDFPQRIIYWLEADGSLAARIEGMQDGKEESAQWRWKASALR
jgi:hypothetical protein